MPGLCLASSLGGTERLRSTSHVDLPLSKHNIGPKPSGSADLAKDSPSKTPHEKESTSHITEVYRVQAEANRRSCLQGAQVVQAFTGVFFEVASRVGMPPVCQKSPLPRSSPFSTRSSRPENALALYTGSRNTPSTLAKSSMAD